MKTREIAKLWTLAIRYYFISIVFIFIFISTFYFFELPINTKGVWIAGGVYIACIPLALTVISFLYFIESKRLSKFLGDQTLLDKFYFFNDTIYKYALMKMSLNQRTNDLKEADRVLNQKEHVIKRLNYDLENSILSERKYHESYMKAINIKSHVLESFQYAFLMMNTSGQILFCNEALKKHFNTDVKTIYDLLDISSTELDFFIKRDVERILLKLKTKEGVVNFYAKSVRQFESDEVIGIYLFIEDVENLSKIKNAHIRKSQIINLLYELSLVVSGNNSIQKVLYEALAKLNYVGFIKECGIRLYEADKGLVLKATNGAKKNDSFIEIKSVVHTHAGISFLKNKTIVLNHSNPLYIREDEVQDYMNRGYNLVYIPLISQDKKIGVLSIVLSKEVEENDLFFFESIGIQLTMAIEKIMLIEEIKTNYFKTVEAFVTATEIKSSRFAGHSRRVAEVCKIIANSLYLSESEIDEIYIAGLLHDVGKLGFSEKDLETGESIHTHGKVGRQMIEKVGLNKKILDGIEHHHLDYNDAAVEAMGLREQPYYAQIIRVSNDLDMFLSYAPRKSFQKTFELEMAIYAGEKYAPNFIRVLNKIFQEENNPIFRMY